MVEVHSFLILASQIQKGDSMDDLLNVLTLFLIRPLLKPSFLRQHNTDSEQYRLAPTSTAKSSTDRPLDYIVVFKARYLLILVMCDDSMFSSQGHVNSITFLKTFEKIVISGPSWVKVARIHIHLFQPIKYKIIYYFHSLLLFFSKFELQASRLQVGFFKELYTLNMYLFATLQRGRRYI